MSLSPLNPADYRDIVRRALDEDLGGGRDITTEATLGVEVRARGRFRVNADCVVAGLDVAFECFRALQPDAQISVLKGDGTRCRAGESAAFIVASARTLLVGERTALNFLQRLSGIATMTHRFVEAARGRITVLDTRKTTPTLRLLEKYAVRAGGATHYRFGLFDAFLIRTTTSRSPAASPRPSRRRARSSRKRRLKSRPTRSTRSRKPSLPAPTSSCSTT